MAAWLLAGALPTGAAGATPPVAAPAPAAAATRPLALVQLDELKGAYAGQLAYAPDGRTWVSGEQQAIGVYQGGARVREIKGVWLDEQSTLAFTADGERLLAGGSIYRFSDGQQLFAARSGALTHDAESGFGVDAAQLTPDAAQCIAWLRFHPSECCRERGHHDRPSSNPPSPVFVIDTRTGTAQPLRLADRGWGEYRALAASSRLLVVGGVTDHATVFARQGLKAVGTLDVDGAFYGFRFSPDGRTLVGIHLGRELVVYDTPQLTRRARFAVLPDGKWISALAVHPKRPVVAVGGWDGMLRLFSIARQDAGRELAALNTGQPSALAFSPTGDELLVAAGDAGKDRILRLVVKPQ
jgi:WD40 repeat protein